jgi:prepilin-type processing-associated H-X9-DG protein
VTTLLAVLCAAGPLTLAAGLLALRALNAGGRPRGRPAALALVGVGALGTLALVLGLGAAVINRWRENAGRAGCANNLRLIGLAVAQYPDHHDGLFPPATLPLAGVPPDRRLSWLAGVLPLLEGAPAPGSRRPAAASLVAYDRPWDDGANRRAAGTNVRLFLCPSDPVNDPRARPGLTDYVGLAGLGADAAALPKGDPRVGFFGYDRQIGPADLTAGASFTLLTTETTLGNGPWLAGGPATARGLDPAEAHPIGPGRPFGGCHAGGLNAAYADAHVAFLQADVDPRILRDEVLLTRPSEPAAR